MRRMKGAIAIAAVALFLSGCGQYKALPTEERYQFINQVKDNLNYATAGEVISEELDKGDGVFSPSIFRTELKGKSTYKELNSRIKALPEVKDCRETKEQIRCKLGQVDIYLNQEENSASSVVLKLTDVFSGREQ